MSFLLFLLKRYSFEVFSAVVIRGCINQTKSLRSIRQIAFFFQTCGIWNTFCFDLSFLYTLSWTYKYMDLIYSLALICTVQSPSTSFVSMNYWAITAACASAAEAAVSSIYPQNMSQILIISTGECHSHYYRCMWTIRCNLFFFYIYLKHLVVFIIIEMHKCLLLWLQFKERYISTLNSNTKTHNKAFIKSST